MNFENKTVVITGAGSGIGAATARAFSKAGANVALLDLDQAELDELASELPADRTLARKADVTDPADIEAGINAAAEHFGGLDVMFNNAGILIQGLATETSVEDWKALMDVNVNGVFYGAKAAIPHLKKTKGCVVNTASLSGLGADRQMAGYNATKGAVVNFTRALAIDHGRDGVRVNSVCPTFIKTSMTEEMGSDDDLVESFLDRIPLGRLGEAEDVANAVMLLASDEARFITGVNLPVDGGVNASNGQPAFEND